MSTGAPSPLGRELLDSKREAILRELVRRVRRCDELRATLAAHLGEARAPSRAR